MSEKLKLLVVAGHPADMFDHCGGTLLHHLEQGDSVTCVSITQGLRVHDEVIYDMFRQKTRDYTEEEMNAIITQRQKVKYQEAVDACALFGIHDVRFLNYDDEILTVNPGMISKLASVMRQVQPDIVITHWPFQGDTFGNHHAVTGQLTLAAINAAHGINFQENYPSVQIAQIAFMLCPSDTASSNMLSRGRTAYANYYVDVSDVVDKKVQAIYMMKSQKYDTTGYAKKTTEQWNGNMGVRIRVPYAEGFALENPEIGRTLPLSEHRKWLARGDERELLEKGSRLDAVDVELK